MIKNIIFDMDGVLINDMKRHAWAWNKSFKLHKIKIPKKDFFLVEGANHKDYMNHLLDKNKIKISEKEKHEIHMKKMEFFQKKGRTKPYRVLKYLQKLKQNKIKMGVATGGHKEIAIPEINSLFPDFFKVIITGQDVKKSKPNPEVYLKTLKKMKIKSSETLVIENAPFGIHAAKAANMKVYALETTLSKSYLQEADKIFKNHKQLFKYLFKKLNLEVK